MRTLRFCLALTTPLVACGPGTDPALGPCGARKPATFIIGTGEDKFEPINGTIRVQRGPAGQGEGSYHIWFAMRCQNMGPRVIAQLGVDDVATGQLLTSLPLRQSIDLEYNPEQHADDVYGIRGFLRDSNFFGGAGGGGPLVDTGELTGRQVRLWVKLDDDCKAHVEREVVATVVGYLAP